MNLGAGGMADVHLAMSRGPQGFVKLFVLKSMKPELLAQPGARKLFLEEARISARLAHPNVVQVFEVIEHGGLPTIVMEYLEGQPLSAVLGNEPSDFPLSLRLHALTKLLAGLHAAHELKTYDGEPVHLVHRDVSPHNVFVLYDGQVKVLDFGIAKASDSKLETEAGILKGKIRYMAPEQLAGDAQDRRADLFAVGVMLWEALARRRLWAGHASAEIMVELLEKRSPELPQDIAVSPGLRAICARALAGERDDRYATAAEFLADLERCIEAEGLRETPETLGASVSLKFAEEKRKAHQVVSAAVQQAELASVLPPPPADGTATLRPGVAAPEEPTEVVDVKRPGRRWGVPMGALALGLIAGSAWLVLRTGPHGAPAKQATQASAVLPASCGTGTKACGGKCVSTDSPETGCAAGACQACALPNATSRCNTDGGCDIAICYLNFENCDGVASNGCEANLKTSAENCGACGRVCPALPHARSGCGDRCTIWRCEAGFRDCNARDADGCEVDVSADSRNCGHCGNACAVGTKCEAGTCQR